MPYFDYAASAPLLPQVRKALLDAFEVTGNPSASHSYGRASRRVLEDARESIAADLGAHSTEVIITSGGSEADVLAISGAILARPERRLVAVSAVEHAAVAGFPGDKIILPVTEDGVVDLAKARRLLVENGDDIALASVMLVNNETGVRQPVATIAELAASLKIWTHTDAVQAVGSVPVNFADLGVQAMSLSAHKLGGPVGVGALLLRRDCPLRASTWGGGQERKLRSGTVPTALVAGLAAAVHASVTALVQVNDRLDRWVADFTDAVLALGGITHNGAGQPTNHRIVNLTFHGVSADELLFLLDQKGVACSTGSACSAGVHQPSDTLLAMGRSLADASSSLRFSFGARTTANEVAELSGTVIESVQRLRGRA